MKYGKDTVTGKRREKNAPGTMRTVMKDIRDLIFPPKCVSCSCAVGYTDKALCPECTRIFEAEKRLPCSGCGRPHAYCTCRVHYAGYAFPLIHVTGYDMKRGSVSGSIVLRLKDEPVSEGFDAVAGWLKEVLLRRCPEFAREDPSAFVYTWLPRSGKAKKKAGHDQSYETAKRLAALCGGKITELFYNASDSSQKRLDRIERLKNAEASYVMLPHRSLAGKTVIMLDDIVTSGASAGVCGAMAKREGAKEVAVLVFAKTERDGEELEPRGNTPGIYG